MTLYCDHPKITLYDDQPIFLTYITIVFKISLFVHFVMAIFLVTLNFCYSVPLLI